MSTVAAFIPALRLGARVGYPNVFKAPIMHAQPHPTGKPRPAVTEREVLIRPCLRRTSPLLAAALLAACTTVSITGNGETRIERQFGVVNLTLSPTTQAMVAEITSLGVQTGPMGVTAGFGRLRLAALPQDCRLMVWIETAAEIAEVRRMLGDSKDVCFVNSTREEKPK